MKRFDLPLLTVVCWVFNVMYQFEIAVEFDVKEPYMDIFDSHPIKNFFPI